MNLKNNISYLKRVAKITLARRFEKQLHFIEKKRLKKIVDDNNKIVLIYTIGKVGSSSVYASLKESKNQIHFPVFHIHSLNPERIKKQKEYYRSSNRKSIPFHLIQSSVLVEILKNYTGKIFVYTFIREPISRELSSLFQDSFNFTTSRKLVRSGMVGLVNTKVKSLTDSLPEEEWFDNELKKVFGFDIYDMNFEPTKGYKILKKKNISLAFARLENLASNFSVINQKLFEENLQVQLVHSNVSEDKFYKQDYKEIKNKINFSNSDLERVLKSRFINKFYPDYKEIIKQKWGRDH